MVATESQEQEALIARAQHHPVLKNLIYAIPNDGKRNIVTGYKFKKRGLRAGMPDICVPIASKGYHALYIELKKSDRKNNPTKKQTECMMHLKNVGNAVFVAYGWVHAWEII